MKRVVSLLLSLTMILTCFCVSPVSFVFALGEVSELMGAEKEDIKLGFNISAPMTYRAGESITVTVTVDGIAVENGLGSVSAILKYDNTRLALTTDIDEDGDNVLMCLASAPETWENMSTTDYVFDENEWVSTPTNDGMVMLGAGTTGLKPEHQATEDGQVSFLLTFDVAADATGDICIYIPNSNEDQNEPYGAENSLNDLIRYNARGSYAIVALEETVESSEEAVTESSGEVIEDSFEESAGSSEETAEDSSDEVVEDSSDEPIAPEIAELMGEVKPDIKLDFSIHAPMTYRAGETLTVSVTVDNITADGGLGAVEAYLYYDSTRLTIVNDIDEDLDFTLDCLTSTPYDKVWENLSSVGYTFDENAWLATPTNDGAVHLCAATTNLRPIYQATADGQIEFTLSFNVADNAEGELLVYIPNAVADLNVPYGGTNTTDTGADGLIKHNARGSYVVIPAEETVDSSEEEFIESSEEVIDSSEEEIIESSEEEVAESSEEEIVESSEEEVAESSEEEIIESSEEITEDSSDEISDNSSEEPALEMGDLDADSDITAIDYNMLERAVLGTYELSDEQHRISDIDFDGDITAIDYNMLKRAVLGTYELPKINE